MAESIKGMLSLLTKLNKMGGSSQEALNKAVMKTTSAARATAQANASGSARVRTSIAERFEKEGDATVGIVFTNGPFAAYREFGTGPVGAANHAGISPHFNPTYSKGPWLHVTKTGKSYTTPGWVYPDENGKFHHTMGQPAKPFLYPAAVMHKDTLNAQAVFEIEAAIKSL